jgi:hypothetical protein
MNYLIHALAAGSLLAGCAAAPSAATTAPLRPAKAQPMNSTVTLEPQRSVAVGPSATLQYDGAHDSRCPPGVQCVWAGELAYMFTLTAAGARESFSLTAAKPSFAATVVAGLQVALGSNAAPPVQPANAPAPSPATPVTVNISHQ